MELDGQNGGQISLFERRNHRKKLSKSDKFVTREAHPQPVGTAFFVFFQI